MGKGFNYEEALNCIAAVGVLAIVFLILSLFVPGIVFNIPIIDQLRTNSVQAGCLVAVMLSLVGYQILNSLKAEKEAKNK